MASIASDQTASDWADGSENGCWFASRTSDTAPRPGPSVRCAALAAPWPLLAAALMLATTLPGWVAAMSQTGDATTRRVTAQPTEAAASGRETIVAGYVGAPFYYRSNVRMTRPDGTDVTLERLGWDGDALYFPIDGGVRSTSWSGALGFMIDFLHNKAIARLGRGAHGRKLADPVIETVTARGTIGGQPAPDRIKLTDLFERLEFTHGHNVLLFTPMLRMGALAPSLRPYVGVGGGVAVPHVEVWFPGGAKEDRTNEYQYTGPAAQLVAGVELQVGRVAWFIEYKFTYAWIDALLTGDKSWKNFNMPGDLLRQVLRWWRGERPRHGTVSTVLGAHQIVGGAGYVWRHAPAAPPVSGH